jgi:hypothetical protein
MTIALLGGPLDGSVSEGLSHMPLYMIASHLIDRPIYKRLCCLKCPNQPVPYLFVGYEKNIESQQDSLLNAS